MSVDILCSAPPLRRACESTKLLPDGSSKCAEIFVTNNADKWTILCAYCEMTTNDIGVFICHIRLDHLNAPAAGHQNSQTGGKEHYVNQNGNDVTKRFPYLPFAEETTAEAQQQQPAASVTIEKELFADIEQEVLTTLYSNNTNINDSLIAPLNQLQNIETKIRLLTDPSKQFSEEINKQIVTVNSSNDVAEEIEGHQGNHNSNADENNDDINMSSDNEETYGDGGGDEKKSHKPQPFKCNKCPRSFASQHGLKLHSKKPHKRATLKCTVCAALYSTNIFIKHVLTHKSDTCFPCQVCGKVYPNDNERKKHWETHAKEMPFYCEICYRRYRTQQLLNCHLKNHNRYPCAVCHIESVSADFKRPPYVCQKCEKLSVVAPKTAGGNEDEDVIEIDSNSESNVMEDSNTVSADLNDDNLLSEDDCSDLDIIEDPCNDNIPSGSSSNQISQNVAAPDGIHKNLHKCQYCNREFFSSNGLTGHIDRKHKKDKQGPLNCHYCQKTFQSNAGLNTHRRMHERMKPFKCPICPFRELRESFFITHVLQHENSSCFPCQVCAKILPTNEERMEHWKIHIKERPYGCNICHRRFYKNLVLQKHMQMHGLYYCHFCGDPFTSADTLQSPYTCMSCEKVTGYKEQSGAMEIVGDEDEEK